MSQKATIALILVLGAGVHLTELTTPNEVIFDEFHFGKFATHYCCNHQRFFDVHPPHPKLLIAGLGWLGGYRGEYNFGQIGQRYPNKKILFLRLLPAVIGTLIPLVFFLLLSEIGVSLGGSFLGALCLAFDNGLVVQTRAVLLDGFLVFSVLASIVCFSRALRAQSALNRWILVLAAGVFVGLAVGTKVLGLSVFAVLGMMLIEHWLLEREHWGRWVLMATIVFVAFLGSYLLGWYFHYKLLTLPGPGDAWYVPTGHFFADLLTVHKHMFSANITLRAEHVYSSPWWSWPLMLKPIYYWQGGGGASIYFIGNPAVWWGGFLLFALTFMTVAWKGMRNFVSADKKLWLPLLGYLTAFLPYAIITRVMFLYHYLVPLCFALATGILWLDGYSGLKDTIRSKIYFIIGAVVVFFFLLLSPITFGFKVPPTYWHFLSKVFLR
ncbi:MAG: phospholipid carrier-dependent glycosyltransferase [Deltaproteobacteria bacterium]|nr:phospholipid carrier-dependent glycosyltransferase [Deltaproteobacteria bacterium]